MKSERRALRKLRDLGIIKRVDLRKLPTRKQRRLIRKYDAVVKGRAVVLKPKNPKSYRNVFKVSGKNVIVPRAKGDRWRLNKAGKITRSRKTAGRSSTATMEPASNVRRPSKGKAPRVAYAIPFGRSGGGVEWYRFPTYDALKKFLAEYESKYRRKYKNADDYILVEELQRGWRLNPPDESEQEDERNSDLDDRLERGLTYRRTQREAFVGNKTGGGYEG